MTQTDLLEPTWLNMRATQLTSDVCIKCNICTSACPVAAVTDLFPGPKVVGPQAQRFRLPAVQGSAPGAASVDHSVDYCSGCGSCSLACPHGVQIAEMNVQAKARLAARDGIPLRNRLLGRTELVGRLGALFAPLSSWVFASPPLRLLIEKIMGISRQAYFPPFSRGSFRSWFSRSAPHVEAPALKVVYFHGCSTNFYEPQVGQAAVRVLAHNGCQVSIAEQNCCGLPLQSNGEFEAARACARANLAKLAPYARQGYFIVGTSSSCTLTFKHEYHSVLGLGGTDLEALSAATYDFFEFLQMLEAQGQLKTDFRPVPGRVIYHAPCQFRTHGVGRPAADLLRRIPGVEVVETTADCCGVAGTYGLKAEKYAIARAVGARVLAEIETVAPERIVCDSETCRWWLQGHAGRPAVHPVQVLAEGYVL